MNVPMRVLFFVFCYLMASEDLEYTNKNHLFILEKHSLQLQRKGQHSAACLQMSSFVFFTEDRKSYAFGMK